MPDVTSPFAFPYPEDTDLVRDGAQDIENLATGVNDYLAGGYLYAGQIRYTSSGSFVKADPFGTGDIGVRAIRVRMVGGGGGGGGAATTGAGENSAGAGGAGATYAESFITDIAGLDTSVVVTRGSAGGGGAAGANSGAAGGDSGFGSLVIAKGGAGGASAGAQAVGFVQLGASSDFTGSVGDIVFSGAASEAILYYSAGVAVSGLAGGSPVAARSQRAQATVTGVNGESNLARSYGAGGGGGANAQNQATARTGAAGITGIVIVDVFV
jgi:hypothetical protein